MDRRGSNTWLVAVLALAVGFLAALLIFGGNDSGKSSAIVDSVTTTTGAVSQTATTPVQPAGTATTTAATTTATPTSVPASPQASEASCLDLWNQSNNRTNQVFLVNLMTRQAVRVHVGVTSDVPPKCLVTVVANNGDAYVFPGAGGSTYPYAQTPGSTPGSTLPAGQKISNALEQRDGTLAGR